MRPLTKWEPCLAGMDRNAAFFDGITIEVDRITDPRWDRVLPILEEEQVYMCRMMEPLLQAKPGAKVLDIGTGSGVFAIYAAKHDCRVVAVDISPRALRFARHNAKINGVQTVDEEPGEGEIRFLRRSYEKCDDEGGFDFVFLAPPYNPTCDGFKPALHADAGKLGQDCFRDQLRHAARLLSRDGICIGNQMVPSDKDGNLDLPDDLDEAFPGGEFKYHRILPQDVPIREFLEGQYATYLKPELKLSPSADEVSRYINDYSKNKFFALVYFELRHRPQSVKESRAKAVIREEASSATPAPKGWGERIKLHRRIIEHTSLEYSFPAPALFLDIDALPNFPERESDDQSPGNYWNGSVLRYIESWLAKAELLNDESGLFDLILVDTAPWYPTPEGRRGLRQESVTWVASQLGGFIKARKFLDSYQDNTERLQKTRIGPFLHRHFTGQNRPNEWRGIQFTVHDISLTAGQVELGTECALVQDMVNDLSNCQIESRTRDILLPPSLLGAAYFTSNLSELGVPAGELDAYNNVVRNRLQNLRKVKGSEASDDELYPHDLEICHQAMHHRLDSLVAGLSLSAKGPSVLIGIPVSLASHDVRSTDVARKDLPDNYRGGIWIYAVARGDWEPESERYLLDLARLLTMQYETEYSELASIELKRIGTDTSRFDWAHETKHIIQALRRWHHKPEEFGLIQADLTAKPERSLEEELSVVPFSTLYQAGLAHLAAWTMANSLSDLPFFNDDTEELPVDLNSLIKVTYECAVDAFLLRLFRKADVVPETFGPLAAVLKHIRKCVPHVNVIGEPDILSKVIDWRSDTCSTEYWVNLSRLLLCEFREALQHCAWGKGVAITTTASACAISSLQFTNVSLDGPFHLNLGDLPPEASFCSMTPEKIADAFTKPVAYATSGVARRGDGSKVRSDLANTLRAKLKGPCMEDGIFKVEYQW